VRAHKLQAVAVACGDDALVAARFACGGKRAQNIVCLKALARHHAVAKARQKLLQNGKLAGQLLRHALALGLVAVVHFVAEGGGLQVEGDGHLVRLHFCLQLQKDIHKAHKGIGVAAVLRGEHLDAVKGAVHDAVAVQYK